MEEFLLEARTRAQNLFEIDPRAQFGWSELRVRRVHTGLHGRNNFQRFRGSSEDHFGLSRLLRPVLCLVSLNYKPSRSASRRCPTSSRQSHRAARR